MNAPTSCEAEPPLQLRRNRGHDPVLDVGDRQFQDANDDQQGGWFAMAELQT